MSLLDWIGIVLGFVVSAVVWLFLLGFFEILVKKKETRNNSWRKGVLVYLVLFIFFNWFVADVIRVNIGHDSMIILIVLEVLAWAMLFAFHDYVLGIIREVFNPYICILYKTSREHTYRLRSIVDLYIVWSKEKLSKGSGLETMMEYTIELLKAYCIVDDGKFVPHPKTEPELNDLLEEVYWNMKIITDNLEKRRQDNECPIELDTKKYKQFLVDIRKDLNELSR